MNYLIAIVLAVVVLYFVYRMASGFAKSDGSFWERVLDGSQGSMTHLGADLITLFGSVMGVFAYMPDLLGSPKLLYAIESLNLDPRALAFVLIGNAVLTKATRNRRLPGTGKPH